MIEKGHISTSSAFAEKGEADPEVAPRGCGQPSDGLSALSPSLPFGGRGKRICRRRYLRLLPGVGKTDHRYNMQQFSDNLSTSRVRKKFVLTRTFLMFASSTRVSTAGDRRCNRDNGYVFASSLNPPDRVIPLQPISSECARDCRRQRSEQRTIRPAPVRNGVSCADRRRS